MISTGVVHMYISVAAAKMLDLRGESGQLKYVTTPHGIMIHRVDPIDERHTARGPHNTNAFSILRYRKSGSYRACSIPMRRNGMDAGHYFLDGPHHIDGIDYFAFIPADEYLDPNNGYITE